MRLCRCVPTERLAPHTTLPWTLAAAGLLTILAGGALWSRPRLGASVTAALGALLMAAALALSRPQKASDADQLNNNRKPVDTAAHVTQAQGVLTTMSAMGAQVQTRMLPALDAQLKLTRGKPQQFSRQNVPATAVALQSFPAAIRRFQRSLVGA